MGTCFAQGVCMYRIVIYEDTESEARTLLGHIERYGAEHGVQFQTTWERSAFGIGIDSERADLIFMDIEMPGMSGMDAASLMRTFDTETPIIFVTNLAQFAVNGYEVDALGFIVKPVSYAAFSMRMAKALRVMRENRESSITVKTHGGMRVLGVEDITFIEVRGHELTYHLADGDTVSARATIAEAEERLADVPFVRISKSFLVNMRHIKGFTMQEVELFDGTPLPIGRTMRDAAIERIVGYLGGTA